MKKCYQGTLLLLTSFIFHQPISVAANIYKWVDDQGNVHYTQKKPSNAEAEKLKVPSRAPVDTSTYSRPTLKKGDAANNSKQAAEKNQQAGEQDNEKKPETAAEKKRRMAACEQARNQLATMESSGRVRSRDKEGNTSYLTPEQKQQRMKKIQDSIAKSCK